MEFIGISPRFFKHELNTYSDWRKAFWRELLQNSVDVNSSRIEIEIEQKEGICHVRFTDNGPGMSEDIMRNVYFQLGATSKEGKDTIGGHGRARILTCFAHNSYEIRTQNILCRGEGGSFEIENTHPYKKGCDITIAIEEANASYMETSLTSLLELCQLPCSLTINGETFTNWLYRRKATRLLSFGTVHTTTKGIRYESIIRVRGVAMFNHYTGCETGIIVEVEAPKSREILTVSRDSFKYESRKELEEFVTEITLDSESIKRDASLNSTEIFGKFRKIGKKAEILEQKKEGVLRLFEPCETTTHYYDFVPAGLGPLPTPEPEEKIPPIPYVVQYEDAPKQIKASAARFHPEQLSGNRLKLLAAWNQTLEFFLEEIHRWKGEDILFMPGFFFGKLGGCHKLQITDGEEGHIICINPLDEQGRIKLSCHDYDELFALGAHECVHTLKRFHDEEYAAILTDLVARTVGRLGELKTRIRKATIDIVKSPEAKTQESLAHAA